jgi:hypothetical protein
VKNDSQTLTVSEMRKALAKILAPLRGDQLVTFSFTAALPDYRHRVVYGELAASDPTDQP